MDLRAHMTALLLAGQGFPTFGRLATDTTATGAEVALGPDGSEAKPNGALLYVMSDEGEATDGHILCQDWNSERISTCGLPVLWHHGRDEARGVLQLGLWTGERVETGVPGTVGRALLAEADLDEVTARTPAEKADIIENARKRRIRGVSIGWEPGETIRRGELPPGHPWYLPARDDDCGQPAEGLIMGSTRKPNIWMEGSLTPVPAQHRAHVRARLEAGAVRAVGAIMRGAEPSPGDISRLKAWLGADPQVRAWVASISRAERMGAEQAQSAPSPIRAIPSSPSGDHLDDFIASKRS